MDINNRELSVCFVLDYSILIGGKERQLLEILKYLNAQGFRFRVVSLSAQGLLYEKLLETYGDRVTVIERQGTGFLKTVRTLRRFIIKNREITIYHSMDSLSIVYLMAASVFLPILIINGSIRHAGVEKSWSFLIDILLLQMSKTIIANSRAGLKYYHIHRGHVLYNAIDGERFTPTKGGFNSLIMVANFSDYKDHGSMFKATTELIREGRIQTVGLVGDGKHQSRWKQFVKQEGLESHYKFYGHNSRVEQILTEYGIGIMCSTSKFKEGISNSILEYMSAGLLAIASDIGATGEIIQSGRNGLLYEAENAADLKRMLVFALDNEKQCREMIEHAYSTLLQKFEYTNNMQKLISIYNGASYQ